MFNLRLSEAVEQVVLRALAYEPDERFDSAPLLASPNAPDISAASISITYLGSDVPAAEEAG